MTFFGYTIGDWAELISIIGVGVSAGSWLFKKIALDPLRSDIQMLSETINRQLKLHEQSLADLNTHLKAHDEELGSHSVRITRLEDHVGIKGDMMMNNWTELLVSLAVAAVPIIGAWISKQLLANKQALTLVKVLGPLANAAVTAAEQLGVTQAIDGEVKKSTAIQAVKDGLKSLGFTSTDEQTIANAVEKAFADLKDSLAETYPQKTADQEASNQDKVAAAAQAAADAVKAQLAPDSAAPQQ